MNESGDERTEREPAPEGAAEGHGLFDQEICWRCGVAFDGRLAQSRFGYDVCPKCGREMHAH